MSYNLNKTTSGEIEIDVTIPAQDLKTESSWAAARLSKNLKISGFRPGKAPYDVVKKEIGEAKILEEAANKLITDNLNKIIKKENLQIAGQPKIEIKKLAAGNELLFKATLSLLPEVILPDFSKIKVLACQPKLEERRLDEALKNLQQMQTKEILERRSAKKDDKVEIDFEVKVDDKVIEGGKAKKYGVIIGENQMIPGFEDQLVGLKENQEKEFDLEFPKNYTKHLAGKKAHFKIKVHGVFKRELPELNDELAKKVGAKNLEDLKNKIKSNLQKEAEIKAKEKQEVEMIEKIIENAKFGPIPEMLIKNEQNRMFNELQFQIEENGGKFNDYLAHIKKNQEELEAGFKDNAKKRVQTQLVFRKIIIDNKLEPKKDLVDEQIKKAEVMYASVPEIAEKIKSDAYRNYVESMILNRQVIEWLKKHITYNI